MILSIHHAQITIPKGRESDARSFYCGVLGLKEIPKPDSLVGRGGLWLELGELQIHIGTEDTIDRGNSKVHIAYLVDDLGAWRTNLAEHKIETADGIQIPNYRRFEFRDPFGNRVELMERV